MQQTIVTPLRLCETSVSRSDPIFLWTCDEEANFDFFSPSWLAFTGRSLPCEQGQGWLDQVILEERDLLWSEILQCLQERRPLQHKFRLKHHDGTWRWIMMEGAVRYGQDGRLAGFVGCCQELPLQDNGHSASSSSALQLASLLKQTQLLALTIDVKGRISFINESLNSLLGNTEENLHQKSFFDYFCLDHPDLQLNQLQLQDVQFLASFETWRIGADRHRILWHSIVQRNYAGDFEGVVLIGEDVTTRQTVENQLLLTSKVFETSKLAMAITDAKGIIVSVNSAFTQLTGYSEEEACGQNPRILQSGRHSREFYNEMWASLNTDGHWHGDIWDRRKDGSIYPKFLSINVIRDEQGTTTHYSSIFSDITDRKSLEEKLSYLAHHDELTMLPNRTLFERKLAQAIAYVAGSMNKVALLYIDLDRFKEVNDKFGHQAGDKVLVEVTKRLKNCTRASDIVARVGGDEFIILLPNIQIRTNIEFIANKIVEALKHPIELGKDEAICTPSIGISVYPDHGTHIDKLIHFADQSMYKVKATTRCGYHFYDPTE